MINAITSHFVERERQIALAVLPPQEPPPPVPFKHHRQFILSESLREELSSLFLKLFRLLSEELSPSEGGSDPLFRVWPLMTRVKKVQWPSPLYIVLYLSGTLLGGG